MTLPTITAELDKVREALREVVYTSDNVKSYGIRCHQESTHVKLEEALTTLDAVIARLGAAGGSDNPNPDDGKRPLSVWDTLWDFLDSNHDHKDHEIAVAALRWIDGKYREAPIPPQQLSSGVKQGRGRG